LGPIRGDGYREFLSVPGKPNRKRVTMGGHYQVGRPILILAITVSILVVVIGAGQLLIAQSSTTALPRTPDGRPDLQGVYNFANLTPMERPPEFAGKTTLTPEEIEAYQRRAEGVGLGRALPLHYDHRVWKDHGEVSNRTSLIIDPPDGRIPALTPEAAKNAPAWTKRPWYGPAATFENIVDSIADGPEDRPLGERCILGRVSGPPLRPETYNNVVQIFQSQTHVALLNEMIHTARIIPLDNRPRDSVRQWAGQSRGRWDEDTLVIETSLLNARVAKFSTRHGSEHMRLVERIRRIDADTLSYQFTIEDPTVWVRPWTAEFPLRKTSALYELACHEGNYGLEGILSAARAVERDAAAKSRK
jgi:hypothetical protein